MRVWRLALLVVWVAPVLGGCATAAPAPSSIEALLPGAGAVPGWTPAADVATYDDTTLFELVNGQAEAFFAYNFQRVAVGTYDDAAGVNLRIEVWQLATTDDAYGLFTRNAAGAAPDAAAAADIGNDRDADPGRRLAFWQDRYYVQVRAREPVADDQIVAFARRVADALPRGGARPDLVSRLPAEGQVPGSLIFFRREISIQDAVWLGGENVLGLDAESSGALAQYTLEGRPALLIAVQYPDAAAAEAALARLEAAQPGGLVAAETDASLLGAVFGDVSATAARELVRELQ